MLMTIQSDLTWFLLTAIGISFKFRYEILIPALSGKVNAVEFSRKYVNI